MENNEIEVQEEIKKSLINDCVSNIKSEVHNLVNEFKEFEEFKEHEEYIDYISKHSKIDNFKNLVNNG